MRIGKLLVTSMLLLACAPNPETFSVNINFGAYEGNEETAWWAARPEIGFRVSRDQDAHVQVLPPPCKESLVAELWRFDGGKWNLEASFEGNFATRLLAESEYVLATDATQCLVPPDVRPLFFRFSIEEKR